MQSPFDKVNDFDNNFELADVAVLESQVKISQFDDVVLVKLLNSFYLIILYYGTIFQFVAMTQPAVHECCPVRQSDSELVILHT